MSDQTTKLRRAVIFANGDLRDPENAVIRIHKHDYIIAADGGAHHCARLGIVPQVIIGDFDSVDPQIVQHLEQQGSRLIRHPRRKDFSDLELALMHTVEGKYSQVIVFAAVGSRWDMTLVNLLMPALSDFHSLQIRIVDGVQEVFIIHPGTCIQLDAEPGDTVSLIPIGGDIDGIITQDLEYPLKNETLYLGTSRGTSNIVQSRQACVKAGKGLLLCTLIRGGAAELESRPQL